MKDESRGTEEGVKGGCEVEIQREERSGRKGIRKFRGKEGEKDESGVKKAGVASLSKIEME